jgi:hypothetical protein
MSKTYKRVFYGQKSRLTRWRWEDSAQKDKTDIIPKQPGSEDHRGFSRVCASSYCVSSQIAIYLTTPPPQSSLTSPHHHGQTTDRHSPHHLLTSSTPPATPPSQPPVHTQLPLTELTSPIPRISTFVKDAWTATLLNLEWNRYGIDMESIWNRYGIDMESIWNRYGIDMGRQERGKSEGDDDDGMGGVWTGWVGSNGGVEQRSGRGKERSGEMGGW